MDSHKVIALIPARSGSKRVAHKNVRTLAGHPLLAYAIATAQEAGIFSRIVVSTDSADIAQVAVCYGAEVVMRPPEYATDTSPDIQWVNHAMEACGGDCDAFAILRPTSPFRRGAWVKSAWAYFLARQPADSLRAIRPAREHPGKMWEMYGDPGWRLSPVISGWSHLYDHDVTAPYHSMPTQQLPSYWVQTAALEIAWARVLPSTIAGAAIVPWETHGQAPEALDINHEDDWQRAEELAAKHPDYLPTPKLQDDAATGFAAEWARLRAAREEQMEVAK